MNEIVWPTGPVLNQGPTSLCWAYAWAGIYTAGSYGDPTATKAQGNAIAQRIVNETGSNDYRPVNLGGWGGLWGAEVGIADGYRWCADLDDLRRVVREVGPVALAVNWRQSMSSPTLRGRLLVQAAQRAGGHVVFIHGHDDARRFKGRKRPAFLVRNSWGRWGLGGSAWITEEDLDLLIRERPSGYRSAAAYPVMSRRVSAADLTREAT